MQVPLNKGTNIVTLLITELRFIEDDMLDHVSRQQHLWSTVLINIYDINILLQLKTIN